MTKKKTEKTPPIWIKVRTTTEERHEWQELASGVGVSLSDLIRSKVNSTRIRCRREPPPADPALLRELAKIGNNLNQLAHAANRRQPATATALLSRLIEVDRELAAIREAHLLPEEAP